MTYKTFAIWITVFLLASCNIPAAATPTIRPGTPVPQVVPTDPAGGTVTLNNVSFTLPLGVANDAQSEMVPAITDPNIAGPAGPMPAHLKFQLTGYQLRDRFHEPQVYVIPAQEYASLNPIAAEQIERVRNVLAGAGMSLASMPTIPFFSAMQQLASQMQLIDFKGGRGVRMLTQYAQYPAPINNRELFYHFQGLTNDGKYYVIAILPVSSSILPEDEKPESPVPPGGVPLPTDVPPGEAYYAAVTEALNTMYPDSFNPSLFQLDALIQSITVTP